MRLLSISDLHGRDVWKTVDVNAYDRIVFLGDYTDSYDLDDNTIYVNLSEILALKQRMPDKITLLIGNHDAQYMYYPKYACSGFRPQAQEKLTELFVTHRACFQIAYQQGTYLFSHAGITTRWLATLLTQTGQARSDFRPSYNLADMLNQAHQQSDQLRDLLFAVGPVRGGYDPYGGPVWADRSESRVDYLTGFHQVVGHTPTKSFLTVGNKTSSITYTDVLRTKIAFYEVIIPD